jgi:cytoskeletal protein CcmA (bactofilin family)
VTVGGDVDVAGQLRLNSKFSAADASLAKLEAGDTSLSKLNVNGDGTISTLSLRKNLGVAGSTQFQGPVTISQLLTVHNNVNVSGSLSVGGTLSAGKFTVSSLTVGGHITTRGSAPSVGKGSSIGSNGTVSISGNDTSGTVAVNIGAGGSSGILANVSFRNQYGSTPHVVVTAIGKSAGSVYVIRDASGFSIGVGGSLSPGGYAFDYIVMQ